jgi:hypothetical protein
MSLKNKITLLFFLSAIYLVAIYIQLQLHIGSDEIWLLNVVQIVLHGGNYFYHFYETTPPLGFLVLTPAVVIHYLTTLSLTNSFKLYVFLCGSLSLLLCHYFIRKMFLMNDQILVHILILSLAIIFFIIPGNAFGEREHFFVMFSTPYYFLVCSRLQRCNINKKMALTVGLLGAVGFCIKPYFLLGFIFCEFYAFCMPKKENKYRIPIEAVCVIAFTLLYLLSIDLFFKPYLLFILPMTLRFYYQAFSSPVIKLMNMGVILIALFAIVSYVGVNKKSGFKYSATLFFLVFIATYLIYFIQHIAWYYHFLPALSASIILTVLFLFSQYKMGQSKIVLFALSLFLLFPQSWLFALTTKRSISQVNDLKPIECFMHKTEKKQLVYFISAYTGYLYGTFHYADVKNQTHFQFLIWMRGYYRKHYFNNRSTQQKKDASILTDQLSREIDQQKPSVVFVDRYYSGKYHGYFKRIDYLSILLKSSSFKKSWKNYRYIMTVGRKGLYRYDIYEHKQKKNSLLTCKTYVSCSNKRGNPLYCASTTRKSY